MRPRWATFTLAACLAAGLAAAGADTYYMVDGDRITGKTVSEAQGLYKVDTPYGRVTIPRGRVAKIAHDGGREEIFNTASSPRDSASSGGPIRLTVVVTGDTFWWAWSGKDEAPRDPSLRLQLSIDEQPVAFYVDSKTDPEIPGATVNSFSFTPPDVGFSGDGRARADAPEARPGRISLTLNLPAAALGERSFRFTYQVNDGSVAQPAWRDVAAAAIHLTLKADAPNLVGIRQDRGRMEFSGSHGGKMKNVETFLLEAKPI